MHIRDFDQADAERLSELIENAIDDMLHGARPKQDWQDPQEYFTPEMILGHSQVRRVLIVEEDGRILAAGSMKNDIISSIFVDPACSGQGIGRFLLEHMENLIKAMGFKSVILTTAIETKSYFHRFGYCQTNTEEKVEDGIVLLSKMFSDKPEPAPC